MKWELEKLYRLATVLFDDRKEDCKAEDSRKEKLASGHREM